MSKKEWTKHHELMYLYLAMAITDKPLNEFEEEEILFCMRDWKADLSRKKHYRLFRDAGKKLASLQNGVEHLQAFEKGLIRLKKKGIHQKPKYYLQILNHLFRIARTDGALHFKEKLILETTTHILEISDAVELDFERGIARASHT